MVSISLILVLSVSMLSMGFALAMFLIYVSLPLLQLYHPSSITLKFYSRWKDQEKTCPREWICDGWEWHMFCSNHSYISWTFCTFHVDCWGYILFCGLGYLMQWIWIHCGYLVLNTFIEFPTSTLSIYCSIEVYNSNVQGGLKHLLFRKYSIVAS